MALTRDRVMHSFLEASNELLRKRGYRLTPQRHMILSVIQEAHEHVTIEQICERVQQQNPYVSLSTVYRTVELLKSIGVIREGHMLDGTVYYEALEGDEHHHLVCRVCGTTIHLDEGLLGDLRERLQEKYQFYDLTLGLTVEGCCNVCRMHTLQEHMRPNEDIKETHDKYK